MEALWRGVWRAGKTVVMSIGWVSSSAFDDGKMVPTARVMSIVTSSQIHQQEHNYHHYLLEEDDFPCPWHCYPQNMTFPEFSQQL